MQAQVDEHDDMGTIRSSFICHIFPILQLGVGEGHLTARFAKVLHMLKLEVFTCIDAADLFKSAPVGLSVGGAEVGLSFVKPNYDGMPQRLEFPSQPQSVDEHC